MSSLNKHDKFKAKYLQNKTKFGLKKENVYSMILEGNNYDSNSSKGELSK